MKRIIVSSVVSLTAVLTLAGGAWAVQEPTYTSTQVSFAVPAGNTATFVLRLWAHQKLLGSATGSKGTLTVAVPTTKDCKFQIDVRSSRPPNGNFVWYSGFKATIADCGVNININ